MYTSAIPISETPFLCNQTTVKIMTNA